VRGSDSGISALPAESPTRPTVALHLFSVMSEEDESIAGLGGRGARARSMNARAPSFGFPTTTFIHPLASLITSRISTLTAAFGRRSGRTV
jgi:hypothetical protein